MRRPLAWSVSAAVVLFGCANAKPILEKAAVAAVDVAAAVEPQATSVPEVPVAEVKASFDPIKAVFDFYINNLGIKDGLAEQAAGDTQFYALKLHLDSEDILNMLAMWHVESQYTDGILGPDGKSWGLTQVRKEYFKGLRKAWARKGVELGSDNDPSAQVAYGVLMYARKLHEAKGDKSKAVRHYNGGGSKARAYGKKVEEVKKLFFGDAQ